MDGPHHFCIGFIQIIGYALRRFFLLNERLILSRAVRDDRRLIGIHAVRILGAGRLPAVTRADWC